MSSVGRTGVRNSARETAGPTEPGSLSTGCGEMDGKTRAIVEEIFETVAEAAPEIRAGLPSRRLKSGAENPSGGGTGLAP